MGEAKGRREKSFIPISKRHISIYLILSILKHVKITKPGSLLFSEDNE